ncbi:MAG TPA: CoA-binding protein [Anaerolineaceae bacterium]|nr:CoA-binding protein [Anaerolineaceae bacterium]
MAKKADVVDFLSQPALAIVGVSRGGKKFGNAILRELKSSGYKVYPVHPAAETLEGERCYPNLKSLPETVGGVVVVVPPAQSEKVVRDAAEAGIPRIWFQQGAESDAAVQAAQASGMRVVSGECILMFANSPVFFHKIHRFVNRVVGKLPA